MESGPNSPQGRRILIAPVTGEPGNRIQRWRERYDPEQARRIPPHITLCYWAPGVEPHILKRQLRHAFERPIVVRLGAIRQFDNSDRTMYVEVLDTDRLDTARRRLYDGTHFQLSGSTDGTWHVTCVRYAASRDMSELRRATGELNLQCEWSIDTVSYLELRSARYEPIAEWRIR